MIFDVTAMQGTKLFQLVSLVLYYIHVCTYVLWAICVQNVYRKLFLFLGCKSDESLRRINPFLSESVEIFTKFYEFIFILSISQFHIRSIIVENIFYVNFDWNDIVNEGRGGVQIHIEELGFENKMENANSSQAFSCWKESHPRKGCASEKI